VPSDWTTPPLIFFHLGCGQRIDALWNFGSWPTILRKTGPAIVRGIDVRGG